MEASLSPIKKFVGSTFQKFDILADEGNNAPSNVFPGLEDIGDASGIKTIEDETNSNAHV